MKKITWYFLGTSLFLLGLFAAVSLPLSSLGTAVATDGDHTRDVLPFLSHHEDGPRSKGEGLQEELGRLLEELAKMKEAGVKPDPAMIERVRELRRHLLGTGREQMPRPRPEMKKLPEDASLLQKVAKPQDQCLIQYHDGTPQYYLPYWAPCDKFLIWVDPARFCPDPIYPWHLEAVHLWLFRGDETYADHAFIKIDAEDCFNPADPSQY